MARNYSRRKPSCPKPTKISFEALTPLILLLASGPAQATILARILSTFEASMRPRSKILDPNSLVLAPGTLVVLTQKFQDEEGFLKSGTLGQVVRSSAGMVTVKTPAGRVFTAARADLVVQKQRVLARASARADAWSLYKNRIIYAAAVGSQAWGLAGPNSDQDVRGVFLWPFTDQAGLLPPQEEIHDPDQDAQYWELSKLFRHALNADPGAIEMLWSPLVLIMTPAGQRIVENRRLFISQGILGSFGRYALSQFKKIQSRLRSGELIREARPKNAYNLIRILHSALRWYREGEPLIEVPSPLREQLLEIKSGAVPIETVLSEGFALAAKLEEEHLRPHKLPAEPDFAGAEALLLELRRAAADSRASFWTAAPKIPAPLLDLRLKDAREQLGAQPIPSPEEIDLVIFDLDDTLFDCYQQCVMPAHLEAAEEMLLAGMESLSPDFSTNREESKLRIRDLRLQLRAAFPKGDLEGMLCAALSLSPSPAVLEAIRRAGQRAFFERDPGALELFPGARDLLEGLRAAGKRIAVVTRGHSKTQEAKAETLGLRPLIDLWQVVPTSEPNKRSGIRAALESTPAERALVVGDNAHDEIAAAFELGLKSCWLNGSGEFNKPPAQSTWTISRLSELGNWLTESEA